MDWETDDPHIQEVLSRMGRVSDKDVVLLYRAARDEIEKRGVTTRPGE